MMLDADIIIVGGGIIGCAILHALARNTNYRVLLIEQHQLASHTTGQSGGLIRIYHPDVYLTELAVQGFDYYQQFQQHTGLTCNFYPTGFLYAAHEPANPLAITIANQVSNAVDKTLALTTLPQELTQQTRLKASSLLYQATAGCINTTVTCQAWAQAALNYGDRIGIRLNTQLLDVVKRQNQIQAIETTQGTFLTKRLILATGAGTGTYLADTHLAKLFTQGSFQYHIYQQPEQLKLPTLIDKTRDLYLIPQPNQTLIAGFLSRDKVVTKKPAVDKAESEELSKAVQDLVPALTKKDLLTEKVSVDAYSAQEHGILQQDPEISGLFVVTGWGGGGIKVAPAVAQRVCQMLSN